MYKKLLKAKNSEEIITTIVNHFQAMNNLCSHVIDEDEVGYEEIYDNEKIIKVPGVDEIIEIPVVYKKGKYDGDFTPQAYGGYMFVTSTNLTVEAVMISILSELWYNARSPHIIFSPTSFSCDNKLVNVIVSEKADYNMRILCEGKETPPAVMDYLFISITYTLYMIWSAYKINILDLHAENIFISSTSYWGGGSLKTFTHMSYKIKNGYLTVPNFGMIPKIGDVGRSFMYLDKQKTYIGDAWFDLENCDHEALIKYASRESRSYLSMVTNIRGFMSISQLEETCVGKLLENELSTFIHETITKDINSLPSAYDILHSKIFHKYFTKNVPANSLLIC